jgi:hypothetical protein
MTKSSLLNFNCEEELKEARDLGVGECTRSGYLKREADGRIVPCFEVIARYFSATYPHEFIKATFHAFFDEGYFGREAAARIGRVKASLERNKKIWTAEVPLAKLGAWLIDVSLPRPTLIIGNTSAAQREQQISTSAIAVRDLLATFAFTQTPVEPAELPVDIVLGTETENISPQDPSGIRQGPLKVRLPVVAEVAQVEPEPSPSPARSPAMEGKVSGAIWLPLEGERPETRKFDLKFAGVSSTS